MVAVGLSSFNNIARQEDPTLINFVASITTFYPGATPDRVEARSGLGVEHVPRVYTS